MSKKKNEIKLNLFPSQNFGLLQENSMCAKNKLVILQSVKQK